MIILNIIIVVANKNKNTHERFIYKMILQYHYVRNLIQSVS